MSLFDAFGYQGKRAGVAAVVKDAGAEVIVMDRADVNEEGVKFIRLDLSDKASIDAAIDECGGPIHALFSCAGVADGTPGIERINFIGHRHMIDKMLADGILGRGSAIGFISSAAGLGWEANLATVKEFLAIPDFDGATQWAVENNKCDYMFSKLAINGYVASQAFPLLKQGIRINAILPGPTNTPLARANADMWLGFGSDYREEAGIEASTPLEQAYPLVFLCSDAASGITGITIVTDAGYVASGVTESFPAATPVVGFLRASMYDN
jgi:NAD(P)-dependent dehydrogenase (short-subunit alcohol dehydrogenase family)